MIETNLTLVGVTAVEDKLQDGVPDTLQTLKEDWGSTQPVKVHHGAHEVCVPWNHCKPISKKVAFRAAVYRGIISVTNPMSSATETADIVAPMANFKKHVVSVTLLT